jgi:hypothetical protein
VLLIAYTEVKGFKQCRWKEKKKRMEITIGEPVAWLRSGRVFGTGEPYQWSVNGVDSVFVYRLRGLEDRWYITDEGREKRASERPHYPTREAAIESLRSRVQ